MGSTFCVTLHRKSLLFLATIVDLFLVFFNQVNFNPLLSFHVWSDFFYSSSEYEEDQDVLDSVLDEGTTTFWDDDDGLLLF